MAKTCRMCRFASPACVLEDTDATIHKLREERDQATGERENLLESCRWWKQRCMNAEHQLAEAKALTPLAPTIEGLQRKNAELCDANMSLCKQRDEAKAEIERLRGKCESEELCKGYLGLCTEAEAVVKFIKAKAVIGGLVLGMKNDHYLLKRENLYHVARRDWGGYWLYIGNAEPTSDPADALRSIQEVGDAEV